jgi:hypothetical protein
MRIVLLCSGLLVSLRADAQTVAYAPEHDFQRAAESASRIPKRLRLTEGLQEWKLRNAVERLRIAAASTVDAAIKPTRSIMDKFRSSGAAPAPSHLRAFFTAGKAGALLKERRNALPGYARYATNLAYLPAGGLGLEYQIAARVGLRGDVTLLVDPEKHFAPRYGVNVVVPLGPR